MKPYQKLISVLLITPLCFGVVVANAYAPSSSYTRHAEAQVGQPVVDFFNHIVNSSTAANTGSIAANTAYTAYVKPALDTVAWTVAKQTIQVITKSTINWINSGYNGSPSFVTNLNGTLLSVANASADSFIKQLASSGAIKSPFQTQIASAVQSAYNLNTSGGFFAANVYNLNKTAANDTAFLGGNFSQGGLSSWISAWANPSNNPYGAYMLASNALNSQVSNAQTTRQTELNWSKGFLSWRGNCTAYADPENANDVKLSNSDGCLSYDIQTPGSVIESQLENTLGSPIRQLELANSVNQIIGAAVTQLTTSVLGSTGLLGLSKSSSVSSSNAPINAITDPSAYGAGTTAAAAGFEQTVTAQKTQIQQYASAWNIIAAAAQQAQAALQSSTCSPNSAEIFQDQVAPIESQAQAAAQKAATATTLLTQIAGEIDDGDPTSASTNYQAYLSSANVPSALDISDSLTQSTDSGTATPTSLYTQLTQITKAAQSCSLNS